MSTLTKLRNRTVVVAFVILMAAVLSVLTIHLFVYPIYPIGEVTKEQQPPDLQPTQVVAPTELQRFQEAYGRWLTTQESIGLREAIGVRNFALLFGNGNVAYAEKTTSFSPQGPWVIARPPEITGVAVDGTSVELSDQRRNRFTLNVTQPFIFEGRLDRVYLVDKNGEIWSAAIAALTIGEVGEVDSVAIPPNPNLSMSYGN